MIFNTMYSNPYRQTYDSKSDQPPDLFVDIEKPIEPPLMSIGQIGQSVAEGGRLGNLIQSTTAAIRTGTAKIELQTNMGGHGEPVGAGSYGKEARQAIREMTKAAGVEILSTHTPVQIGNLSGFNPQSGFSDEQRKQSLEEVKKAIDFAADTTGGGAIIIHTGEYQRPISEQQWAKNPDGTYKFLGFQEEPGRAVFYMVDDRTGRIISDVRKSQVIREPIYKEADKDGWTTDLRGNKVFVHKDVDWVDDDGHYLDPKVADDLFKRVPKWDREKTRFQTRKLDWEEIEKRTRRYNEKNPEKQITAEQEAFQIQMQTQMLQYRGSSLYHGRIYEEQKRQMEALKKSLAYYEKLEKEIPEEDVWRIIKQDPIHHRTDLVPADYKKPSEIIKRELRQVEQSIQYTHEASAAADAQADTISDTLEHVKPVSEYAKEQSMKSYAEAAIHAMQQSEVHKGVKKPLFVAPENIFPEMGYGSHPEELLGLVENARKEMVRQLTSKKIEDASRGFDKDGKPYIIQNPNYIEGMSADRAKELSERHIKATIDTQHFGMWRAHFVPKPGETKQDTDERFNKWYMEEIKKLADKKIIGHVHLVDSLGYGHHALPAGQGNLPLKDAIEYLKKKGYDGTIISEGWEEDRFEEGRIMKEAWKFMGSPVYSHQVGRFGPPTWPQMDMGWYGKPMPPLYIFGAYSPSNDWVLWSEVPLE